MTIFLIIAGFFIAVVILMEYQHNRSMQRQFHQVINEINEAVYESIRLQNTNQEATLEKFEAIENLSRKREEKAERFYKEIIVIHDSMKSQQEELSAKVSALNGHEQLIIKEVQELKGDEQLVTKLRRKKK